MRAWMKSLGNGGAQAIHGQIFFESFHEVLALAPSDVVVIQLPGREILAVGDHKATVEPALAHFHLGHHAPLPVPTVGLRRAR